VNFTRLEKQAIHLNFVMQLPTVAALLAVADWSDNITDCCDCAVEIVDILVEKLGVEE